MLVRDIRVRKAAEAQLQRQARWQTAAAEIRLSLLSEASLGASLALVCTWAVDLSSASAAALVVDAAGLRTLLATAGDAAVLGRLADQVGNLENLTKNATMSLGDGLSSTTVPILFAKGQGARTGALVVVEPDEAAPEPGTDQVLASLAGQAVLAYELATVRSQRDLLLISADRERIARDLHDLVIQRLFGAGLSTPGGSRADRQRDGFRAGSRPPSTTSTPRSKRSGKRFSPSNPRLVSGCGPEGARSGGGRHRRARLQAGVSFHGAVTARLPYRCSSKPKPSSKRPSPTPLACSCQPSRSRTSP